MTKVAEYLLEIQRGTQVHCQLFVSPAQLFKISSVWNLLLDINIYSTGDRTIKISSVVAEHNLIY